MNVFIFNDFEMLDHKSLRVVVRTDRVDQIAAGNERALGNIAFAENHLLGVGRDVVRVVVKIARKAIDRYGLR